MTFQLADFDFELPERLIASAPAERRDAARLLTLDRASGAIGESAIDRLPELLQPGDLLVLNDTRVIPARLAGVKPTGGKVEIFLVRRLASAGEEWQALLRCSKPARPGTAVILPEGVVATVLGPAASDCWQVAFSGSDDFPAWLERNGAVPLPPYIRRGQEQFDRERYQTVFAREPGAVAAPTAGLHFTEPLLAAIRERGVAIASLTLHVGLGTFLPIRVEDPTRHRMHCEIYNVPPTTVAAIRQCRAAGGRVVAVGTTVARALESAAAAGEIVAGGGETDIFIYPGYRFRVVDALLTNFHLPKSTLLLLVSAFAGRDAVLKAYATAIDREFRFYSYGDAMFIF